MKEKINSFQFHHLLIGGSFDHFHIGHKRLLETAFRVGKKVTIGLMTQELIKNKFLSQTIEDYVKRKKILIDYLVSKKYDGRFKICQLRDIYGPSISDEKYEAIVVSKTTYKNALKINRLRKKKKLPLLKIITVPFVRGDDGEIVSSERIRLGIINREGENYQLSVFGSRRKSLILPEHLRESLRQPLGNIFRGREDQLEETAKKLVQSFKRLNPVTVITVGDIISFSLEKIGFLPDIKIIDFRTRRKRIRDDSPKISSQAVFLPLLDTSSIYSRLNFNLSSFLQVINHAGTLSSQVGYLFSQAMISYLNDGKKQTIIVKGEEDLAALPAILLAPLNSVVLYGQMDLGVVAVLVTEEKKRKVEKILRKFF